MIRANKLDDYLDENEDEIEYEGEIIESEQCIVPRMGMRYDFLKTFWYGMMLSFFFLFISIWYRVRIRELSKASIIFENMGSYMNRMAYYFSELEEAKGKAGKC